MFQGQSIRVEAREHGVVELCCDARVMSEATQIGLPEVSLGLFPGFGGTVRLPRIASAAIAIEWISTGKPQPARSALAAGVVEKVTSPDALRRAATDVLRFLIRSGDWRARRGDQEEQPGLCPNRAQGQASRAGRGGVAGRYGHHHRVQYLFAVDL
jgi:3-hydroxyacyl-CoA dehydrogenase / enoyl-CoA hydratase / 3-hydroxybutyryl-CoA epimerase / enoyl-CoA isomerase